MPFLTRLSQLRTSYRAYTGLLLFSAVLYVSNPQAAFAQSATPADAATSTNQQTPEPAPSPNQESQTPPQPGQPARPAQPESAARSAAQAVTNLPNTLSAPPFTVRDKFDYRVIQTFGLRGALGAGVAASVGQLAGSPKEWGGGVKGYAERVGSAFGGNLARQSFAFGLESALHEDPRYFPSEDKGFRERILNALKQVVACKTDSGRSSFAYARVVSAFGAGQFVNIWQPSSNNSVGDGLLRGFYSLGGDFGYNMLQEFFPFTRPHSIRHRGALRDAPQNP